jgi:hypothetical protein
LADEHRTPSIPHPEEQRSCVSKDEAELFALSAEEFRTPPIPHPEEQRSCVSKDAGPDLIPRHASDERTADVMTKTRKQTCPQSVAQSRASDTALRGWSDLLRMWAACGNAACREARCCRGAIRACAPQNFAALPEGVRALACGLLAAKAEGLSFDAAIEGFAGSRADTAWNAWCRRTEAR